MRSGFGRAGRSGHPPAALVDGAGWRHSLLGLKPTFFSALGLIVLVPGVWAAEPPGGSASRNAAAIVRELGDFSQAGMDRRLGPGYAFYHAGSTAEKFPEQWMPPVREEAKGRRYEIGGPWTPLVSGDFSSTQGQILYVPDAGFGMDRVTILEWAHGSFSERPEPPWNGGFRPEPALAAWQKSAGGDPGAPIAMARGVGGWANCGVAIFASGLVATAGTVTAEGGNPIFRFPKNKLPTAIAITNKNEFALITVVDTDRRTGQVAVLALESSGRESRFPHEWSEPHPGLPNVAVFTHLKLLGYIDLPGLDFPTGISAVSDAAPTRLNGRDGNAGLLSSFDLAQQSDRDIFNTGDNAAYSSRCGFAAIIGKYEGRVAFLDLQPLFVRLREMYYTTGENYRKTRELGDGPHEWPYTFAVDPGWAPRLVTVLEQREPTAVLVTLARGSEARAFVASRDGQVRLYRVGGLATPAVALPAEIKVAGVVQVGRNPVCLAPDKTNSQAIIAVSRGDREISWISYSAAGGQVVRRLRDARLLDPVFVEVADTHGIETALLTVADFNGRQILNYRYAPVVFATQGGARFGMGERGTAEFECGGLMKFPGWPFCLSATNVN